MNTVTETIEHPFGSPEYIAAQPLTTYEHDPIDCDPFIEFRVEACASISEIIKGLQRLRLRNDRWHVSNELVLHLFS